MTYSAVIAHMDVSAEPMGIPEEPENIPHGVTNKKTNMMELDF